MTPSLSCDVAVIGNGPVGACAAIAFAQAGFSVALIDRRETPFPMPRACFIDHEVRRILLGLGLGAELDAVLRPTTRQTFFDADWQVLVDFELPVSPTGEALGYTFYQPEFEAVVAAVVRRTPGITCHLGMELIAAAQDAEGCHLTLQPGRLDAQERWQAFDQPALTGRCKWVVGADGAHSLVRKLIGSEWRNLGFEADWLVVDVEPAADWTMDHAEPAQWCNPARPTTLVPTGRRTRRWEFMLLPGEDPAAMQLPDRVWSLLSRWIAPEQGRLIRHTVYRFRSLVAERWRRDRMFLAGDAAHLMPPFLGQGMCSGLRDVWNLAWKLAWVEAGRAPARLLDSYEVERRPHVTGLIGTVVELGRYLCTTDVARARLRDAEMRSGRADVLASAVPPLAHGLVAEGSPLAGRLVLHERLDTAWANDEEAARVPAFMVVHRGPLRLSAAARATLDRLGMRVLEAERAPGWSGFLSQQALCAAVVRPDFYVYGAAATPDELDRLLQSLGREA